MADRGISTSLGPFAEMSEPGRAHVSRRTRASVSLNVGAALDTSRQLDKSCLTETQFTRPQRAKREQAKQGRRDPSYGRIGPLPLGLDAEMAADLGKRHLDGSAAKEPTQVSTGSALRSAHKKHAAAAHR